MNKKVKDLLEMSLDDLDILAEETRNNCSKNIIDEQNPLEDTISLEDFRQLGIEIIKKMYKEYSENCSN